MGVKEMNPVAVLLAIGLPCSDIQLTGVCVCACVRAVSLPSMPQLRGERLQDTSSSQPLLTHHTSCRGGRGGAAAETAAVLPLSPRFGLIQMCSLIRRWGTAIIRFLQEKKNEGGKTKKKTCREW